MIQGWWWVELYLFFFLFFNIVINDGGKGGGKKTEFHPNDKQGEIHWCCYDIVQGNSLSVGTTWGDWSSTILMAKDAKVKGCYYYFHNTKMCLLWLWHLATNVQT